VGSFAGGNFLLGFCPSRVVRLLSMVFPDIIPPSLRIKTILEGNRLSYLSHGSGNELFEGGDNRSD